MSDAEGNPLSDQSKLALDLAPDSSERSSERDGEVKRQMASRRNASWCVGIVGTILLLVGLAHNWLGLPSLQRAVARGEVASRIAEPQLINWAVSGGAISVLGLVCLLHVGELRRGSRVAWRVTLLIGGFFVLVGVGAYVRTGSPGILIFAGLGSLIVVPLLLWARDFRGQQEPR